MSRHVVRMHASSTPTFMHVLSGARLAATSLLLWVFGWAGTTLTYLLQRLFSVSGRHRFGA